MTTDRYMIYIYIAHLVQIIAYNDGDIGLSIIIDISTDGTPED